MKIKDFLNNGEIREYEKGEVIKTIGEEFLKGAELVGIFGSTVRMERKEESDIDIISINKNTSSYGEVYVKFDNNVEINLVRVNPNISGKDENEKALLRMKNSAIYCTIDEFKNELLDLLN